MPLTLASSNALVEEPQMVLENSIGEAQPAEKHTRETNKIFKGNLDIGGYYSKFDCVRNEPFLRANQREEQTIFNIHPT